MPRLATYLRYRDVATYCREHHSLDDPIAARIFPSPRKLARTEYEDLARDVLRLREDAEIPKKTPRRVNAKTDESLAMLLSDLHIGKRSSLDGKTQFDVEIASTRVARIVQNARHLWDQYMARVHKIEELHLFLCGDIVDGEQTYSGQQWNVELPVIEQVKVAAKLLKQNVLNWGSDEFTNVYVHSVCGNHGEIRGDGTDLGYNPSSNFDNFVALILETACADLTNVHFDIGLERLHVATVRDHRFLMMHKAPAQAQTAAGRSRFGGWKSRFNADAFVSGHWHNVRLDNWNGVPILYNGGLFGSEDDYTQALGFDGYPSQILFSIADKRPIANFWVVDLR